MCRSEHGHLTAVLCSSACRPARLVHVTLLLEWWTHRRNPASWTNYPSISATPWTGSWGKLFVAAQRLQRRVPPIRSTVYDHVPIQPCRRIPRSRSDSKISSCLSYMFTFIVTPIVFIATDVFIFASSERLIFFIIFTLSVYVPLHDVSRVLDLFFLSNSICPIINAYFIHYFCCWSVLYRANSVATKQFLLFYLTFKIVLYLLVCESDIHHNGVLFNLQSFNTYLYWGIVQYKYIWKIVKYLRMGVNHVYMY